MSVITNRFFNDFLSSFKSEIPMARPIPIIGPMSGDTSMAPIITAVEFTLRPIEARNMANTRIQTFRPLNSELYEILLIVASASQSCLILMSRCRDSVIFEKFGFAIVFGLIYYANIKKLRIMNYELRVSSLSTSNSKS